MFSSILRRLIVIAIITNVLSFTYSEGVVDRVDDVTGQLLSFNGFNSIVFLAEWFLYFYYAIQLFVLLALLTLHRWAERLFLVNIAAFTVLWLVTGVGISMPIEIFLGTLTGFSYGAIAILVFLRISDAPLARRDVADS